MSSNQQQLIKKYFNSLVEEFIKDPNHKDITIVFKDYIEKGVLGDTLGRTEYGRTGGIIHTNTTWEEANGVKVPGSEKVTTTQDPYIYKYTVSFLNHYQDEERWRGTVAHEFSHLYLYSKGDDDHDHDDTFYSKMDQFEDWLDGHYGLSPRKDKGGDWNQHVDYNKRKQRENQYPTQSQNDNDDWTPRPSYRDTPEGKEWEEWFRLTDLIRNAKTLTELENNWQTVKNSPLYDTNKRIWNEKDENNKERLDKTYTTYKRRFCTDCLNHKEKHQSNCPNKCSKCSDSRLKSASEQCHNINCENYCFDPKWDKEREERKKLEDSSSQKDPKQDQDRQENSKGRSKKNSTNNEQKEFNRLVDSLRNIKNLTELKQIWEEIKNSSVYSDSKHNWKDKSLSNKKGLDDEYSDLKSRFSSSNKLNEQSYPTKNNNPWIPFAVIGGAIIGIWLIFKLFFRSSSVRKKPKK